MLFLCTRRFVEGVVKEAYRLDFVRRSEVGISEGHRKSNFPIDYPFPIEYFSIVISLLSHVNSIT